MNDNERKISEKYEAQGYDVIHVGVPDFILLKDGEIEFVEVKTAVDGLRESQIRTIALLEKHGFTVKIERVPTVQKSALLAEWIKTSQANPAHSRPNHATPIHAKPSQARPLARSKPCHARPSQARPIHSTPAHPKPLQSRPSQARPVHPMPDQTIPSQSTPSHLKPQGSEMIEM